MFLDDGIAQVDLAFIFGTNHYKKLIALVSDLWQKRLFNKVLISGGHKFTDSINEAESIAKQLIAEELPVNKLLLENKSTNTLENVLFSKKLLEEKDVLKNINSILIVAKNYHARRALMTIKKYFPKNIKFYIATYDAYGFDKNDWWQRIENKNRVINEFEKIKKYLDKKDIEEL